MTLIEYVENLQKIITKNPEYAKLTVIFSSDDEGNDYQKVYNTPTLVEVDDLLDRYLYVCFSDSGEDSETPNAILIN